MLKIHLLPAILILITMNFVTMGLLILHLFYGAMVSGLLAAGFVWANVNNEVLGKELREYIYGR